MDRWAGQDAMEGGGQISLLCVLVYVVFNSHTVVKCCAWRQF